MDILVRHTELLKLYGDRLLLWKDTDHAEAYGYSKEEKEANVKEVQRKIDELLKMVNS